MKEMLLCKFNTDGSISCILVQIAYAMLILTCNYKLQMSMRFFDLLDMYVYDFTTYLCMYVSHER